MNTGGYETNGDTFNSVMVGCGCKSAKDVLAFIKEKKIDYAELQWADEMGLWHNGVIPASSLNLAGLVDGIPSSAGMVLIPNPLSARIVPFSHPNVIILTCADVCQKETKLKTKQLNPVWVEMISKQLMASMDKRPADIHSKLLNPEMTDPTLQPHRARSPPLSTSFDSPNKDYFIDWKIVKPDRNFRGSPTDAFDSPPSILINSLDRSSSTVPSTSLPSSPYDQDSPRSPRSPLSCSSGSEGRSQPGSPSSCLSLSVPGSPPSPVTPCMTPSQISPNNQIAPNQVSFDVGSVRKVPTFPEGSVFHKTDAAHVPPLLRPRQVHPTKAHKLGIVKPVKKRRNTENLYCRHCGTTETPEWRRGPDGRKSLCNACGLYYSKMVKRETLVVPQSRRSAIGDLLNPSGDGLCHPSNP